MNYHLFETIIACNPTKKKKKTMIDFSIKYPNKGLHVIKPRNLTKTYFSSKINTISCITF